VFDLHFRFDLPGELIKAAAAPGQVVVRSAQLLFASKITVLRAQERVVEAAHAAERIEQVVEESGARVRSREAQGFDDERDERLGIVYRADVPAGLARNASRVESTSMVLAS
jgi:hypothetical protein